MASGNPLIDQGILNRVRGAVVWSNFPTLNVTAPYLDREGINLRLTGQASAQLPTLTGTVQSPECYMPISVVIALLKTQLLADQYKTQMELNAVIGPGTVFPDVSTGLGSYQLQNCAIESVGDLLFNGTTPIFAVTCTGFYVVGNALFF
jgi:hypothetical protein